MFEKVHEAIKLLIDLSKSETDHISFLENAVHSLSESFKLSKSLTVFGIDGQIFECEYSQKRNQFTNYVLKEESLNDRLSSIIADKSEEYGHSLTIHDNKDSLTGIINFSLTDNTENAFEILTEAKDIFHLIFTYHYRQFQLGERVKELSCLHQINKIAKQVDLSTDELLSKIVKLLPPAWQFPTYTYSRITFNKNVFISEPFVETNLLLKSEIIIDKENSGHVEVFLAESFRKPLNEPFLKEEEILISTIAQELKNILKRRIIEEERKQLEQQLLHADRLATLGQLSAGIAHEINEPLAGILGLAQLMEKNPSLNNEAMSDLENIISASLHAREVVKKLMLFARQMPSSHSKLNLNDAVKNAQFFLESRCNKEGIRIELNLAENIPMISADSSQIHQVLINLIVNAMQAMNDGGKITISTYFDEFNIYLKCEDTGSGIPEEIIDKIFNPFFTTKKVNEGTGLGLSVVHGIIYSHNGEITVSSKENIGTEFIVSLPGIESYEK